MDDARLEIIQAAYQDKPLPAPRLVTYTVSEGETLFTIAVRYGLTPAQLADINKLPPNFRLMAGDTLWVPWQLDQASNSTPLAKTGTISQITPFPIATWSAKTPKFPFSVPDRTGLVLTVVLGVLMFGGVMAFIRWVEKCR